MEIVPSRGIRISDIRLLIPYVRTPLGRAKFYKFYVEIKYDGKRKAKTMKKHPDGDCVRWEEFSLQIADITDESMITITVTKIHIAEIIIETIGSFERNVVNLIHSGHSGACRLEISKDSQLKFSIEEISNIIPIMIDEASKSTVENQEDALSLFLSRFEIFMSAIDAASALTPYAKLAWNILSLIPKTILSHKGRNKSIGSLCEKLKEVYDYITDAARLPELKDTHTRSKTLLLLVQQTVECAYFIREYGTGSIVGKVWKGGSIDDKIKSFNEKLDHYQSVITGSITLETGIVTLRIADDTAKIADTTAETKDLILLNEVPYAQDAGFVSRKRCLPGTRQHLIDKIVEWVNSDAPQRILVLSGQAGTGKSAVAHTIAEIFKKQNRLGSMFCFNRSFKDRCNLLFSTISRGLADGDVLWRKSLVEIIQDTATRTSKDPVTQFDELIAKPSQAVTTIGPVVIVIDALDESGDRAERATILDLLFRHCSELPSHYRFIVTSRPEQDIEALYQNTTAVLVKRMGDIPITETFSDIQNYVSSRLGSIASILDRIEEDWSNILAKRARGLFQWAETACRFIDPTVKYQPTIQKRWSTCVSDSLSSLYEFYEQIISSQPECRDPQFVEEFKVVVGALMVAREPLTINTLQNILQDIIPDIQTILRPFGSLFLGVDNPSVFIQPLHTSLFDFLNDPSDTINNQYCINMADQSLVTSGCLKLMNRMLRFNICGLETSHLRNGDISDFQERVKKTVPTHLSYASRFWAVHLHSSGLSRSLIAEIRILMNDNLLFWFEVLSLLDEIEKGCSAMSILRDWSQNAGSDLAILATQASDACHFGLTCQEAMSGSTPHLYLSALPFAPQSSFISKQYLPQYPQLFSFDMDQSVDFNPAEIGVMKRHTSSVAISRFAFSPRDRYVASGFSNGEICLLDYGTGEQIKQWKPQPQLDTESNEISDIVFSPDGELIYGCFPSARRILIWNIKTNDVKQVYYGSASYTGTCYFSTISSDGQYIAFDCRTEVLLFDQSSSRSLTIDHSRSSTMDRFECGQQQETRCQFSPSGYLFAYVIAQHPIWVFSHRRRRGSDVQVKLWDTRKRVPVKSWSGSDTLALSDSYIAVWKFNGCIKVWDLTTMTLVRSLNHSILEPDSANHIQFSANNQYILSSYNNTYYIWTLSTGELIHQSHTNGTIYHLALSPDLKYIALADSDDPGTTYIRQWAPHILQQSSLDDLTSKSLSIRNVWLHGAYLVLVFHHGLLQIWDIKTTNTIVFEVIIGHSAAMVFSIQDVVYVAYGMEDSDTSTPRYELRLWNESGRQLHLNAKGIVTALAFSVSKNYLIFGDDRGTLKIWDIHNHRFVFGPCSVEGSVKALDFSSSRTTVDVLVAYTKNSSNAYFEIRECQPGLRAFAGPYRCSVHSTFSSGDEIAFSANEGYVLFISCKGVEIFDATTGSEVSDKIDYQGVSSSGRRLSPDGKYFAWVKGRELKLWDMDNKTPHFEDHSGGYHSVLCFSNDSKQLITVATIEDQDLEDPRFDINVMPDAHSNTTRVHNYYITIWDIQTMKPIKKVRYPAIESFDVLALHDGHLVLGPSDSPTVWSLHALSAAARRYDDYICGAASGTFPVSSSEIVRSTSDTSIPITNSSSADNMDSEVLDYSLKAWNKALFSTQMKSGWVLGPRGELLFWVPKEKRGGLWYPGMKHMATKNITKLNFDNFVHGTRWTECRRPCDDFDMQLSIRRGFRSIHRF